MLMGIWNDTSPVFIFMHQILCIFCAVCAQLESRHGILGMQGEGERQSCNQRREDSLTATCMIQRCAAGLSSVLPATSQSIKLQTIDNARFVAATHCRVMNDCRNTIIMIAIHIRVHRAH